MAMAQRPRPAIAYRLWGAITLGGFGAGIGVYKFQQYFSIFTEYKFHYSR